MLFTWSDTGLHDRMLTVCHCRNFDQPALVTCRSGISRKLRHSVSGVAVLIFFYTHTRDHFSLNYIFRIGNGSLINCHTFTKFHRLSTQRTGYRQFIISQWCCRRLKAGTDLNSRINSDTDRDRKLLSQFLSTLRHSSDMSCSRCKENGKLIFSLNAETVNRYIMNSCIRVCGIAHAKCDIRTCIIRRIGWCWNQFIKVKIRICCLMHYLLARCIPFKIYRWNRILHTFTEHLSKIFRPGIKQSGNSLSTCQKTDGHLCIRMSFHMIKDHGRTFFCRTLYRSAGSYIAVYPCKFCHRIYFHICLDQLIRHLFQKCQGTS